MIREHDGERRWRDSAEIREHDRELREAKNGEAVARAGERQALEYLAKARERIAALEAVVRHLEGKE